VKKSRMIKGNLYVVGNHFWFFLSLGFILSYGTSLFSWLILIDVYLCYFEKMKIKYFLC
jgi:hypothetical protein